MKQRIDDYLQRDIYPFHMPGHKRNPGFLLRNPFLYDLTEIDGMDYLNNPDGIIKELLCRISKTFGSDESFFLVNGSTQGIHTAISYVLNNTMIKKKCILAARNSHKALFNSLYLNRGKARYIYPDRTKYGFAGSINPQAVKEAFRLNDDIGAVFITSPTYEGVVSDIKTIAEITHKHNAILIVDEAHGAHFAFSDYFPKDSMSCGADIVIQSLHKTLPSPGQTAVVHITNKYIDSDCFRYIYKMYGTSSPSYMFMASVDLCLNLMTKDTIDKYTKLLNKYRFEFLQYFGLELFTKIDEIFDYDKGKLVFINNTDYSDYGLCNLLRDQYKIQIEAEYNSHIILMTSPADTEKGFIRLLRAVSKFDKQRKARRTKVKQTKAIKQYDLYMNRPEKILELREAVDSKTEEIDISETDGRISAEFIIPYPPGIPILIPGEKIILQGLKYDKNKINVVR